MKDKLIDFWDYLEDKHPLFYYWTIVVAVILAVFLVLLIIIGIAYLVIYPILLLIVVPIVFGTIAWKARKYWIEFKNE